MSSPVILVPMAFRTVCGACDVKMGLKEVGMVGGYSMDWIDLAQNRGKWQAVVKLLVP